MHFQAYKSTMSTFHQHGMCFHALHRICIPTRFANADWGRDHHNICLFCTTRDYTTQLYNQLSVFYWTFFCLYRWKYSIEYKKYERFKSRNIFYILFLLKQRWVFMGRNQNESKWISEWARETWTTLYFLSWFVTRRIASDEGGLRFCGRPSCLTKRSLFFFLPFKYFALYKWRMEQ